MEKKAIKKATAKKKTAAPEKVEIKSPFDEVAADLSEPPSVAGGLTSSSRPAKLKKTRAAKPTLEPVAVATAPTKAESERGAIATGSAPKKKPVKHNKPTLDATAEVAATKPKVELSPAFKTLATPALPELKRENRARLMMQTPTKAYFYWSVRENPYHLLKRSFGGDMGSYSLVLKLNELRRGVEEIHRVEPEGNWWFNVEPDGKYEAEIGFYAPNRPYFRVLYSNTIETPRRAPSPNAATDADWKIAAHKFAEVLEVAGFTQDAFDVALAGDDHERAEHTTHEAFSHLIGSGNHDLRGIAPEDIRYALMALASGLKIDDLRSRISSALFAILQSNSETIAAGNAMSVLTEYFDIDETEFTEREHSSAVFGASRVNFPRTLKTRRVAPVSSHSFR